MFKSSSARIPLVLLPGLLNDEALWDHQCRTLSDIAQVQVADLTRHDSISAMAADVLAHAPESFALAGMSMGGYVAMEIMRIAPHRVSRLALLDTTANPDTLEQTLRRKAFIRLSQTGRFRGVTGKLLPFLVHPPNAERPELARTVFAMAARVGREAFARQQTAIMHRPDSRDDLASYRCQVLVLCGRHDQLTPIELHREMATKIHDSRLVVIEDSGHLTPLEQPIAVSAVLRYWLG